MNKIKNITSTNYLEKPKIKKLSKRNQRIFTNLQIIKIIKICNQE